MNLKKWEIAMIAAVLITALSCVSLSAGQKELADKLIRLHVVANSDSGDDQEAKLLVRDRVLTELDTMLAGVTERDEAIDIIESNLDEIARVSGEELAKSGLEYRVRAAIAAENFPTRDYDTFSLPAGRYESLRVEIGAAAGKNWWCVVFPPICGTAAGDKVTAMRSLSGGEVSLITKDTPGYVIKFKSLELLQRLRAWIGI